VYIQNIFFAVKLVLTDDVIKKYEDDYNNCNIRYGDMKKQWLRIGKIYFAN